jgi:hypothetical protein
VNTAPRPFPRRRSIGQLLRLIRPWNLPTAVVDPYAGYLIAAGLADASVVRLLGVMLVSALIYSAGMAWNDIFDLARDGTLHADRPLPSGLIGRGAAAAFAALLILLGFAVSAFLGISVVLLCCGLVALTFTYNGWLKHKGFIGCLNMGACRFMNMMLGIAAADGALRGLWPFPATLGLYVTAVTLLSLQEEASLTREGFFEIVSLIIIVLLPLAGFSVVRTERYLALVPITLLAGWVFAAAMAAARSLTPGSIGSVVRVAVTGVILVDTALLFSRGRMVEGIICAFVVLPTLALVRYAASRPVPAGTS